MLFLINLHPLRQNINIQIYKIASQRIWQDAGDRWVEPSEAELWFSCLHQLSAACLANGKVN